ncbi:aminotransferase class III-fold pyridoxal phosphate-dependent enzyme [Rhizobium lusitanum]|uniref:Aminotransferase class III-fold pyridoxal phosphate-dependent enzyme n=1 Tax=Rhizobium lusitanum TaxID=293958 RepID=A0A6L9UKD5_9HYPH|nr:aminotransferase class III-fold pyridoxal phosphate-dependent enzyme [Rhizobium lusitanum]
MKPSPVWHPFTQHALEPRMERIASTEGAYLFDEQSRAYLDMISSWWVITHGHRHRPIMDAIRDATRRFDQIIFAEFSHEPAEILAAGLIAIAPAGLKHVFYSDSGSTSVEVALKMALGFFHNHGEGRDRIVVLEHSYHGDTIGTMSARARRPGRCSQYPQPSHQSCRTGNCGRVCGCRCRRLTRTECTSETRDPVGRSCDERQRLRLDQDPRRGQQPALRS